MKNRLICFILGFIIGVLVKYTYPPNKRPHIKSKQHISVRHINYIVSHVSITCYHPIESECDNDPLVTSDGSHINLEHLKSGKIKWCAISQDLLYLFPTNKPKRIWIDGFGLYEVRDVMNKRYKHKVDLLIHPKNSMRIKIENVKIKIMK